MDDRIGELRDIEDPILQARLAGQELTRLQQEAAEVARIRKEAINRAHSEGREFKQIAEELGLTKQRITQIRQSAPDPERAFFGIGPVTIAVPSRQLAERDLPVISSEDARAFNRLHQLLINFALQVDAFHIPPNGIWEPPAADVIAICGPLNSTVTARALRSDPFLTFSQDDAGRWAIRERDGSMIYESPLDDHQQPTNSDVAYLGRLQLDDHRTLLVIAGVHALGSVGAVAHLEQHLAELYDQVGTQRFSMVVGSEHDGDKVIRTEVLCPPRIHPSEQRS